jgi:hypothetical protein
MDPALQALTKQLKEFIKNINAVQEELKKGH